MATLRRNSRSRRAQPEAPAKPQGNHTGEKRENQRLILRNKRPKPAGETTSEPDPQPPEDQTNQTNHTIRNHTD